MDYPFVKECLDRSGVLIGTPFNIKHIDMRKLMVGLFFYASAFIFHVNAFAKGDFETIKSRVVAELMKPEVDESKISDLLNSQREDGTWPGINYEDVSRTGFEHRIHLSNMVLLARAYKKKGNKYYGNKKVKKSIERALSFWNDNDFICDNWWHNQIGTPNSLVTLMLIVGDELPKDLVEKAQPIIGRAGINAQGARPGGDRIHIASIEAENLLFLGDEAQFTKVLKVIEGEIKFVSSLGGTYGYGFREIASGFQAFSEANGRGLQYDNSFHHRTDGVNNTLSYGLNYAQAFAEWAFYTANTRFAFSDDKLAQLVNYFLDGICKTAVYGKYPDMGAKNRSISRQGALHAYSPSIAKRLLVATDYRKGELQEIVDIRSKSAKPTLSHATAFWQSDHFSFQRPDFFASVRMYSNRIHNMEWPYNSEGLLNHHRGDGANHVYTTGDEYYDIAPVYDYQKIPGATIMQKPALPPPDEIQKLGLTDFVGAVTDGLYGAAAFDFHSPHDPLIARKSWFFFDHEYVCLGAGISATSNDLHVVTTLNQCLLRGEVTISKKHQKSSAEGTALPEAKGEREISDVDWVFHDGIGYVFPEPTTVHLKNSEATGSWFLINKQTDSPKDEVHLDVFKLWLDHGKRPSDAAYEYIVVPATTIKNLEQNTSRENIQILSNTPELQAVKQRELGICQMVFYTSGQVEVAPGITIKSDSPAIIMVKVGASQTGGHYNKITEISATDPTRHLSTIHLSVSSKIDKSGENFEAHWNEAKKISEISMDLPQGDYAGKSVTFKF